MQHQLSDGEPHPARRGPPVLWESAHHPEPPPPPPGPCVFAISFHPGGTFTLTSPADGVAFDLDADGRAERISWTEPGADVAWLAVDRDGDSRITNGRELIGDRLMPQARSAPDALMTFALEGRAGAAPAFLDSHNSRFLQFILWTDGNHNGISEAGELRSVRHVLSDIALGFERHHRMDRHGNESRYRGIAHVGAAPGPNRASTPEEERARIRWMFDVCLVPQ